MVARLPLLIIVIVLIRMILFSCSTSINLTSEQRKTVEGNKFARFKIRPCEIAKGTIAGYVSYSVTKGMIKKDK